MKPFLFFIIAMTTTLSWAETFELRKSGKIMKFLKSHPEIASIAAAANLSRPFHYYVQNLLVDPTETLTDGMLRCKLDVTMEMTSKEYSAILTYSKTLKINNAGCPDVDTYTYVYKPQNKAIE